MDYETKSKIQMHDMKNTHFTKNSIEHYTKMLNENKILRQKLEKDNNNLEKHNKILQDTIVKLQKKIENRKKKDDDILAAKILKKANKGIKKLDIKLEWMEKDNQIIELIINKCKYIYKMIPFSGKEGHYQMALEQELRLEGAHVLSELARPYHYKLSNGLSVQMPYNITGREDLVLPQTKIVLELKQTGKITEKEKNQICRYMTERKNNTEWGEDVRGFLINFGDIDLDIYYACYSEGKINMIRVHNERKTELKELINMYEL